MREAELVFRTMQHPADEGTHYSRWGLVGLAGAVVLTAIMWDDPDSDTAKSMDTMWRQRFGHPMHPLWADLGFHSRRPLPYEAPTELLPRRLLRREERMTDTAQPEMPFIIRRAPRNGAKLRHYTAHDVRIRRLEVTKSTGRSLGSLFNVVEGTGKYRRDFVRMIANDAVDGHGTKRSHSDHIRMDAAGVKSIIRRLRPEEATQLAAADLEITELETQLATKRRERAALLAEAWSKAHVVRLTEIERIAAETA